MVDIESDQSPLATQEVEFEDDQLRVTESPTVTVCEDEENELILGFTILTGGLVSEEPPPPPPHETIKIKHIIKIFRLFIGIVGDFLIVLINYITI